MNLRFRDRLNGNHVSIVLAARAQNPLPAHRRRLHYITISSEKYYYAFYDNMLFIKALKRRTILCIHIILYVSQNCKNRPSHGIGAKIVLKGAQVCSTLIEEAENPIHIGRV